LKGIRVRPISFDDWKPWKNRKRPSDASREGGVYLLAHCQSGSPPARASEGSLPREVVYVGVTKDLNSRPILGRHDGVSKYHKQIDRTDERLFVAFAPLFETDCDDYAQQRVYAQHVEALLVWRFTEQHGYPPALHYGHKGKFREQIAQVIAKLRSEIPW
jgi:hypothetical protein